MSALTEYFDSLRGRSIAVIGMGVSNMPLIRMLLRADLKVTVCDRQSREKAQEQVSELESLGAKLRLGEDYLEKLYKFDVIFRTPGISPNTPQIREAVERGAALTSEMELFFSVCPCRIVAVTGSDGKTTTTTIIAELLKAAGYNVYVGGNIGKPLLPHVPGMTQDDVAVLELSSFQLMTMQQSPHIAVFTNLSPNHLDYHHTMEEYTKAKMNIYYHQSAGDRAIFNFDNDVTRSMAKNAPAEVMLFSRRQGLEEGVYLRDGAIWLTNKMGSREVLPLSMIQLPGEHNIENYMAAIAAVDGLVPDKCVRAVARNFKGVEHRIELVRVLDGVRYYNDSIGTSPSRTRSGLMAFEQKVILIAGGYDKQIPFDELGADIIERVKLLILTGDTAEKIKLAVETVSGYQPGAPRIILAGGFEDAVKTARELAREGDVVLLSPACAAFDRFKNFVERGNTFKRIINEF
ncbi:MAG: UDP-N-acetylmuramoyl-L-alanine--D-glutamate ligase [Oscillospiraceae bacterium]|nr:UDP-N-acetylmuramoyl-L-alanine--D-glutamate ligase [Oscillospiraceae bacterium]